MGEEETEAVVKEIEDVEREGVFAAPDDAG